MAPPPHTHTKQIVNISQSGTAMIYTYVKLRRFLQENHQIEKVVLSINPSSLNNDKWVYSTENLNSNLPLYFAFLDNFDIKILSKDKLSAFCSGILKIPLSNFRVIIKTMMGSKCTYHDLPIGGFLNRSGSHIEPSDKHLYNLPFDPATQKGLIQKLYLDKIVDLCHINNIKLYFITTPLYGSNGDKEFSNYLKSTYTDVPYLNYSALTMPDEYFHDYIHLNGDGAKYFTPIFIKDINKSDIE